MQRLEVSGAVRPIEGSLGVKGLMLFRKIIAVYRENRPEKCNFKMFKGVISTVITVP
jgi:hypothetical protein